VAGYARVMEGDESMSRRTFDDDLYRIVAGWNPQLQSHFFSVYERDDPFGTAIFSTLRLQDLMVTLEQLADMLNAHGLNAPPTLLSDLRMDAEQNRGDFDVHYDPETGTASIQSEYGDREDNDALDFGVKSPEQAVRDGYELEVLYPRDFGEASADPSAQSPVETSRIHELVDRVREWFHRGQDRGMDL
jgi:hypothetical protein